MSGQARIKSLQAPIFKTRTMAIPAKFWKSLLVHSGETARWRLRTYKDLDMEEVLVLLVGAHPRGVAAFQIKLEK